MKNWRPRAAKTSADSADANYIKISGIWSVPWVAGWVGGTWRGSGLGNTENISPGNPQIDIDIGPGPSLPCDIYLEELGFQKVPNRPLKNFTTATGLSMGERIPGYHIRKHSLFIVCRSVIVHTPHYRHLLIMTTDQAPHRTHRARPLPSTTFRGHIRQSLSTDLTV